MSYSKIGFITGVGGNPTGIGAFIQELDAAGIPAVIFANDTTTGLSDILNLVTDVEHVMLYRVVYPDNTKPMEYFSVPDYNKTPQAAADEHWYKIEAYFPQEVRDNRDRVWIQPINEVDKNRADWLGYFSLELAKIANIQGYKVAMLAWSSGEPEPEHWREQGVLEYLRYCQTSNDMAGIAVHEYDYGLKGMSTVYPYHIGRFQELFNACLEHNISRPLVFVTEFGWAYDNIPEISRCMSDIRYASELYAQYKEVVGVGTWYLGPGFGGIANKVNALITPVKEYTLNTILPDPPEENDDNILYNSSFEYGWYHPNDIPELQIPNGWQFWSADSSVPNPISSDPWSVFVRPEVRVLPKSSLPPNEQNLFVLDGNYTLKPFKGYGSIFFSLSQPVSSGNYRININVYPDLIVGYNPDGTKIFADDPEACFVWIETSTGQSAKLNPVPGAWNKLTFDFSVDQEDSLEVFFMLPFALVNNGLFLDKWEMIKMDNCNAREPYKREFWVANGGMSEEDYVELCRRAYRDSKQTVGFSYDDAGIGCGLTSKKAVLYNIDQEDRQTFLDWYQEHYPGTEVEFSFFP